MLKISNWPTTNNNSPTCTPQNPPQPDQPIYGFIALQTVPTFTRPSYLNAFGVQPLDFDATKPPKFWFDSTVDLSSPENIAVYQTVQLDGITASIVQLQMPATQAASVNIPGLITYPPYVIQPTTATLGGQPFNADVLSDLQDAINMAASFGLGSSTVFDGDPTFGPFLVDYPAAEPRRQWMILFKGAAVSVGILLSSMNAKGIGSPGAWDLTGSQPVWVPVPPPPDGITSGVPLSATTVPIPVRPLLPNEEIVSTLGGAMIARTDMSSAATNSGSGFGPADRATLLWIQQALQQAGLGGTS
jgi:hypothetical protein